MKRMKKSVALVLALTLSLGMCVNAFASQQVITFDEDGKGSVSTETPTPTPTPQATEVITPTPTPEAKEKSGIESILESLFGTSEEKSDKKVDKKGYLCLGADLSAEQKTTVLTLLGVSGDELNDYDVVTTTNQEEHAALDKYIDSSLIGTKSLSSVLVKPAESGHGVVVTTHNINFCTTNMYRNALITAGVTDADITVAAPTPISGTAALIGALKAYEKMSGEKVSEKALDTSLNELVTTGQIKDELGNDDQAEELISYIKTVVATNDLDTEEEIEAAIRKGMKDFNVTLSDEEIKETVSLMVKIKAMGIDYKVLAEQADDIYAKYKDDIAAGTFDISKVDLEDLGLKEIISQSLANTAKNVGEGIKNFFSGIFGK